MELGTYWKGANNREKGGAGTATNNDLPGVALGSSFVESWGRLTYDKFFAVGF